MDFQEKRERAIIRDFAIADHQEGERPFFTEYVARHVKPCVECGGSGKCRCIACLHNNKGNCLFCAPSPQVVKWRAGGHKGEISA